jgi:hypothetical protein
MLSARLGLVIDGVLIEEKVVRGAREVTLGQSAKCTVSVPVDGLPRSVPVLRPVEGGWELAVPEGGEGRVGGERVAVVRSGQRVVLGRGGRAKVRVGEVTLLLQVIETRAVPQVQLPRGVRMRLVDRIDPYMAAVALFSLLVHGVAIGWLHGKDSKRLVVDWASEQRGSLQHRFEPVPLPVFPPDEGPITAPAGNVPLAPTAPGPVTSTPRGGAREPGKPVDPNAVRGVIAVVGSQGDGRFEDVTEGKNPGGELQAGIDRARRDGTQVTVLGPGGVRGPDTGTLGPSDGPPIVKGPTGPRDTKVKVGEEDVGIIEPKPPEPLDPGDLDAEAVYAKMKAYRGQIQKCYSDALKRDGALKGRVDVTLTIGVSGNVTAVEADGFDAGMDACIEAGARSWRFAKPPAGSATFRFPFAFRPAR